MTEEQNQPLLVLEGLENNPPTELNILQQFLLPHMDFLVVMWWVVWATVLFIVVLKFVIMPLIRKK